MKKAFVLIIAVLLVVFALSSCATSSSGTPTVVGGWKYVGEDYTEILWFTDTGRYVCEYIEDDYTDIDIYDYEYVQDIEVDETNPSMDLYIDGYYERDFFIEGNILHLDGYDYKRFTKTAKDNSSKIKGTWKCDLFKMAFISNGTFICDGYYKNNGIYRIEDERLLLNSNYDLDYLIINNTLYLEDAFDVSYSYYLKFERTSSAGVNSSNLSFVINYSPWTYVSDDGDYAYIYAIYQNGRYNAVRQSYLTGSTESYSGTYIFDNIYIYLSGDLNRTLTIAYVDDVLFGYSY